MIGYRENTRVVRKNGRRALVSAVGNGLPFFVCYHLESGNSRKTLKAPLTSTPLMRALRPFLRTTPGISLPPVPGLHACLAVTRPIDRKRFKVGIKPGTILVSPRFDTYTGCLRLLNSFLCHDRTSAFLLLLHVSLYTNIPIYNPPRSQSATRASLCNETALD